MWCYDEDWLKLLIISSTDYFPKSAPHRKSKDCVVCHEKRWKNRDSMVQCPDQFYPTSLRGVFVILLTGTFQLSNSSEPPSARVLARVQQTDWFRHIVQERGCVRGTPRERPRAAPVKSCCGDFHPADPPPAQRTWEPEPTKREQSKAKRDEGTNRAGWRWQRAEPRHIKD